MIQGLDRARWTRLSPYLDEALEMPRAERPTWLEGLRARDPILATELADLLAEYDRVEEEDFLERQPLTPRATLAGLTLGAYTLRTQIGRGGMGSVWLADRSDGRYEGVAAVKLLNVSLIGLEAEERFRREGSFLARLRHPHIARLLDAGVSVLGQPYLVLEHVDGEHLDAYCDRRRLTVAARVRLFLDVLAAVSHAHANLIVHRDLKPSNVLVDGEGVVKLLDFGVAKLLAPDAHAAPTTVTREGRNWVTPEYAAPEQLSRGDITTATDVFAMGVLLFELLSGCQPDRPALRASLPEVPAVRDGEPGRLSKAATAQEGETRPAHTRAENRDTTPEGLRRALRGDLETIVAKAIKTDPAERYESVAALADDLRRYLEHVPIRARPDAFTYRAAKFVRRHWLPVAFASLLLVAMSAGLAGTLWQARVAARQRDVAMAQLDRAESINLFSEYLLGQAVPSGKPVRVRDIMERAEQLAGQRSGHDPALAVDLLVSIGGIYVLHEEADNAQRTMKRAYDLAQGVADPATRARATCGWARAIDLGGDQEGALRLIDAGLGLTSGDERFDLIAAGCLIDRASVAVTTESADLVKTSAQGALHRLDRRPGALPEFRASALELMGTGHNMAGETAAADRMFAEAYDLLRRIGRGESADALAVLHNWAGNAALTNPLAAVEQNRRLIGIFEGDPDGTVPLPSLYNYGLQLNRVGRYREARTVLERLQSLSRRHGHPQGLASSAVQLVHACRELRDLACARENLRVAEAAVPSAPGHRIRGDLLREQALLAEGDGRDADAHRLLLQALAIHEEPGERTVTQIETLLQLSRLELRLGSAAEAEQRARAALALAEGFRGGTPCSSWVGRSLLALGAARQAQGDAAGARELYSQSLAHMTPTLGPEHPAVAVARQALAR